MEEELQQAQTEIMRK